jgi:hypothetical protein
MVEIKRQWTASSEPSAVFVSCFSVPPEMLPLSNWVEAIRTSADNDLRTLSGTQAEIDEIVETASELSAADLALLDDVLGAAPAEALTEELDQSCVELPARFWVNQVISYAFGCTVGHWDVGLAVNADLPAILGDPLGPLPVRAPGILTGADGLPLAAPPPNYPIAFPTDGILVDDPGHDRDLLTRIRQVFTILFSDDGEARLAEAVSILDPRADDLRPWLRRTFFEEHIQRYSKSRRKAPIYWRLGTPSGSYSVWIYLHRFTKDTLHRVMNDHVAPKLRYEQNRLDALSTDAGPSPTPSQRREIDALATLLEELQSLRDEVARLTPLWDPDLDDGVIINAAPLHRLFAHTRSWQKECETTWKKLCAGDYDWAHLSMRLWPERVVPKCCDDRSLAIAHGLEDTLWLESQGGKWHPKPIPDTEVAELVRQRTSAAVKDALRQLGESPAPIAARRTPTPRPERAPPAPRPPKPPRAQRVEQPTLDLEGRAPPAEALGALRIALRDFPDGAGKSELLAASGIDEALWTPSVNALLAAGEVQRFGEKRGTKYRWTGGES